MSRHHASLANWKIMWHLLGTLFRCLDYTSLKGNFTFLGICPKNIICGKAFLLLSHFHLLFPRLLLPTASSYLHLARSHHQLRRNCVNIKISSKASEKYRLRFEFLYKVGRAFLVKCIHCGGARLGVFLSYILSSILRRFYSCYSQNGIYSADKAD